LSGHRNDEDGNGRHEHRTQQDQAVWNASAGEPGDQAEHTAEDHLQSPGGQRQHDSGGPPGSHPGGDRPAGEVGTEIEVQQTLEVVDVLQPQRVVEVVSSTQGGHHRDRQGTVAGESRDGVALEREHHGVDQEGDPEEHDHQFTDAT
jgi:hypothetical protein